MKSKRTLQTLAALSALAFPSTVLAQAGGPLDPPPGAPAPSMKSLDQMEPRTPLIVGAPGVGVSASGGIRISARGSYYLTENLTITSGNGVTILATGVTLDLRGFTITSSAASSSGSGIQISANHVSVHNGHIISGITFDSGASGDQFTGSGFNNGVLATSFSHTNIHIRNLSVSGCNFSGIFCGSFDSTLVEFCTVQTVGATGIQAGVVRDCNVSECGGSGIVAETVMNCRAESTGGNGIRSTGTVSNSFGFTNGNLSSDDGINATRSVNSSFGQSNNSAGGRGIFSEGTVSNSYGQSRGSHGIRSSLTVSNSYGQSQGADGISSEGTVSNSCGYTNGSSGSDDGIFARRTISNSFGWSDHVGGGDGINSPLISYSYGRSDGISVLSTGIDALTAIGCFADGGQRITDSFLMP